MDEFNEKDPLWDILGQARRAEASPFFVRKVLRSLKEKDRPGFSVSSLLRWLIPASAAAALVIGWSSFHSSDPVPQDQSLAEFNEYFDTAAGLSALIAQDSSVVWADSN
jgi:hypothetical protein